MPNVDLLDKTMKHIEKNEEGWNQGAWRYVDGLSRGEPKLLPTICGTAMCFAGEAVTIDETYTWLITVEDLKKVTTSTPSATRLAMDMLLDAVVVGDGYAGYSYLQAHPLTGVEYRVARAENVAQRLLGLDSDEADVLFSERNGMEDLKQMVEAFKEGKDITNMVFPRDDTDDDDAF